MSLSHPISHGLSRALRSSLSGLTASAAAAPRPAAPTLAVQSDNPEELTYTIADVDGSPTDYQLQRSATGAAPWTAVSISSDTAAIAQPAGHWYYRARTTYATGPASEWSAVQEVDVAAIPVPTLTVTSPAQATLHYVVSDYEGAPDSFDFHKSMTGSEGDAESFNLPNAEDSLLQEPGRTYFYRTRTVISGTPGAWSNWVSVAITALAPLEVIPTDLEADPIELGKLDYPDADPGESNSLWRWDDVEQKFEATLRLPAWPWGSENTREIGYYDDEDAWIALVSAISDTDASTQVFYVSQIAKPIDLQVRMIYSGSMDYLGEPSAAYSTVIPFEPPTGVDASVVNGGATADVSVTWVAPSYTTDLVEYDLAVFNTDIVAVIATGVSPVESPLSFSATVDSTPAPVDGNFQSSVRCNFVTIPGDPEADPPTADYIIPPSPKALFNGTIVSV